MPQMLPRTTFAVERGDYSGEYYHATHPTGPLSINIPLTVPPGYGVVRVEGRMRAGSSYFSGVSGSFNVYANSTGGTLLASGSCPATGDNGSGGASDPGGFNGLATWDIDPSSTGAIYPSQSIQSIQMYWSWGGSLAMLFGNPWRIDYWISPMPASSGMIV